MATARATADTTPQSLFTAPNVAKARVTGILIRNNGSARRSITFEDAFTVGPSVLNPTPAQQVEVRAVADVDPATTLALSLQDLGGGFEVLGELRVVADAVDPAVDIVVYYEEVR